MVERAFDKLVLLHGVDLACLVNREAGARLSNSVPLQNLYYWDKSLGFTYYDGSPKIWVKTLIQLSSDQRREISTPLGIVNRYLSKTDNIANPLLRDLREYDIEQIAKWSSNGKFLGEKRAIFIYNLFKVNE